MDTPPDLIRAWNELRDAQPAYTAAHSYAQGRTPHHNALPAAADDTDFTDRPFNLARVAITAVTSRLKLADITADTPGTPVLQLVDWQDITTRIVNQAATYGDAYALVWAHDQGVDVRVLDPRTTRAIYGPDDDRTPEYAIRAWEERPADPTAGRRATIRATLYYDDRIERYVSTDGGQAWTPWADPDGYDGDHIVFHDLGALPVVHVPFGVPDPFGQPEHLEAYTAQDMVNITVATHGGSIAFHGWPQLYALYEIGAAAGTSGLGALEANDVETDVSGSTDPRGEVAALRRAPGTIWGLRAKELAELPPAPVDGLLSTLAYYGPIMGTLTTTPERLYAAPGGQHPAADSLEAGDALFRDKITTRERQAAAGLRQIAGLYLEAFGASGVDVVVSWTPPEIQLGSGFWESASLRLAAGVPKRVVLLEAGYTPAQVDAWGYTEDTVAPGSEQ